MSEHENFSDEFLDRYICGDLSREENDQITQALEHDEQLRQRLEDFRQTREWIQYAYNNVAGNEVSDEKSADNRKNISAQWIRYAAAFLLLVTGAVTAWLIKPAAQAPVNNNTIWRVVLHINSSDTYLQNTLLDETKRLLDSYKKKKRKLQVEIVAYGKGVSLIEKNKSPFIERLHRLQHDNPNLAIVACGRTLSRIRQKQPGFELMQNVVVAPSGIRQIIKRQQQGWSYIRI